MRVVRSAAWVVLVIVGSIAAAGLVVTLDHRPTDEGRPELTARDAAILASRLREIDPALARMDLAARAMGGAGQDVLLGLRALDAEAAAVALAAGDGALGEVAAAAAQARALAPGLLDGLGAGTRLPNVDRDRVAAIGSALAATDDLGSAWASVRAAGALPLRLLDARRAHDDALAHAAELGRAQTYAEALVALDAVDAAFAGMTAVRDEAAAAGRDTSALGPWLGLVAADDAALRTLYAALDGAEGVLTRPAQRALDAVHASQDVLLGARESLVTAVADLGAGDITPALLAIDDVRGAIEAAVADTAVADTGADG